MPQIEAPYMEPPSLSEEDESANVSAEDNSDNKDKSDILDKFEGAFNRYKTEQLPFFNSIGEFYATLEQSM